MLKSTYVCFGIMNHADLWYLCIRPKENANYSIKNYRCEESLLGNLVNLKYLQETSKDWQKYFSL